MYQLTSVRLPQPILNAIESQLDAVQNWRDAQTRVMVHNNQFTHDMQRAIDANDHNFEPLIGHERIGQELVDHLEEMTAKMVNTAENLAIAWVLAFGSPK